MKSLSQHLEKAMIHDAPSLRLTLGFAVFGFSLAVLAPVLRAIRDGGAKGFGAIASALNERNIPTARSSRWHVSSVANLVARTQKLEAIR